MHQQHAAFENIVGKGEIARYEQILLFPKCFLLNQIIVSPFVHIYDIISLFAAEFEKPKIGISGKSIKFLYLPFNPFPKKPVFTCLGLVFNPFPNKPWFLCVFLKTLQETEKLLVKSNFSFSLSVFSLFGEYFATFIKFEIVVCKLLSLEESKIYRLGKG